MNHTELADALQDFAGLGWIPGITQILDGLTAIDHAARTGRLSADATQTLLTTIANPNGPDLTHLLALTIKTLTGPDNQALHGLDDDTRKQIQHLGEQHAWEVAEFAPRDQPNEAAGLIYQHSPKDAGRRCTAMTDTEREELSKKVAEANKRSENRPR
ncbi:hypothetical protein [Streptomyces mexicanus]|uniref:hypothetical protein n=1 Tax=Streptomyces mexicanus TaxID=178566 RepID=UPI003655038E